MVKGAGVCGEGVDMSAGQVCECGENKTWTWEWMWVWCGVEMCGEGGGCECVCGVELSVACRVVK